MTPKEFESLFEGLPHATRWDAIEILLQTPNPTKEDVDYTCGVVNDIVLGNRSPPIGADVLL